MNIETLESVKEYHCRDCKFSTPIHFVDKLSKYFWPIATLKDLSCTKHTYAVHSTNGDFLMPRDCLKARTNPGLCGKQGKCWTAKHSKDIFKILKREIHD